VRSPFDAVAEDEIRDAVAHRWGLALEDLRYLPEGGGAYHWVARTGDGRRWFVTCDDLDTKPWLGADRDTVFGGLLAAYGAAVDLRAAGSSFVAAPIATASGAPTVRVDARHAVSVFQHVDGEPGRWGRSPGGLDEVIAVLARLHGSTAALRAVARRGFEVPGRDDLDDALANLDGRWDGGPLSEPARRELAAHVDAVVGALADLDRLAGRMDGRVDGSGPPAVVTHGEPHPGNLIRTGTGLVLVDWDTVALARPERDLWMLADADGGPRPDVLRAYRDLTGVTLDPDALSAHRLLWALTDLAAFTRQLRREHQRDTDAERALTGLRDILAGREPSPYGGPAGWHPDRPSAPSAPFATGGRATPASPRPRRGRRSPS
jgi:spectinomycin phosphotransferase